MGRNYFWFEGKGRKPCSRLSLGLFIFVFFFSPFNLCVLVRCILKFLKCVFPQSFPLTLIFAIDIPFSLAHLHSSLHVHTFSRCLAHTLPPRASFAFFSRTRCLSRIIRNVSRMLSTPSNSLSKTLSRTTSFHIRLPIDCFTAVPERYAIESGHEQWRGKRVRHGCAEDTDTAHLPYRSGGKGWEGHRRVIELGGDRGDKGVSVIDIQGC